QPAGHYLQARPFRAGSSDTRTPASFGGAKELLTRTQLTANDADLTIGTGPEVNGPALSLLLAVMGRRVALDDLHGPGVATLAEGA
ncbi:hypothetical protein ABZT43_30270, partial [Streptomyces sp. NPDC005349]